MEEKKKVEEELEKAKKENKMIKEKLNNDTKLDENEQENGLPYGIIKK